LAGADGGIASNFFYGGPMDESDTFSATWRREPMAISECAFRG
jgi:hypothetical protein